MLNLARPAYLINAEMISCLTKFFTFYIAHGHKAIPDLFKKDFCLYRGNNKYILLGDSVLGSKQWQVPLDLCPHYWSDEQI